MIIGTYLSEPTDKNVLLEFYRRTRPFGAWGPIRERVPGHLMEKINSENRRDIIATFFAVPWQIVLFLTGMTIIMKTWSQFATLLLILVFLSLGLYYFWYRHLSTEVRMDD